MTEAGVRSGFGECGIAGQRGDLHTPLFKEGPAAFSQGFFDHLFAFNHEAGNHLYDYNRDCSETMPTSQHRGGPSTFGHSDHPDSSCRLPASYLDDSSHLAFNTSFPLSNTGGGPPQPYNDLVVASSPCDEQFLRFSFQNDLVLPNSYQFASSAPENSIYPSTQPHLLNQSAGDHISDLSAAPMSRSSMQSSLPRLAPAPPKPTNPMSFSDGSTLLENRPQPSPVSVDHQTRGEVSLGGIPIRSKPIERSPIEGGFTLQGRPTAGIVHQHYPPYSHKFKTSAEARAHRKSSRLPPKKDRVSFWIKTYFRDYYVVKIYNAMISTDKATDGPTSCHLRRIMTRSIDPADLEATAHHVFDAAIAVHEEGWCRPLIYHNEARGKLRVDCVKNSIDRLRSICECLEQSKAAVNDAIQGGVTLHRLVNNPMERTKAKRNNNRSNALRKRQLEAGIKALKDEGESKRRKTSEEALSEVNDGGDDDEDYQE